MHRTTICHHQALWHALTNSAGRPEYVKPLREEIELILSTDGWNKGQDTKLESQSAEVLTTKR